MQGKCSPRTLNTSAAFIVHCAWGIFINLNTRFPFCIVVSFCRIPLIYKDFLLDPFQGSSLQVEILSVCLFGRPSSLLILFLYSQFLLDPFQGSSLQVEILSICLFVHLSVITSYSFPFLSDSTLMRVTQPLPRYPMSPSMSPMPPPPHSPVNWSPLPVNWSPNEQDHLADLF